jgi:hypothetical protein
MSKEITKTALLKELHEILQNDYSIDWLCLTITGVAPEAESIWNPRKNFIAKAEYIDKAYNEDLTMKAVPTIAISHFKFFTDKEAAEDFYDWNDPEDYGCCPHCGCDC